MGALLLAAVGVAAILLVRVLCVTGLGIVLRGRGGRSEGEGRWKWRGGGGGEEWRVDESREGEVEGGEGLRVESREYLGGFLRQLRLGRLASLLQSFGRCLWEERVWNAVECCGKSVECKV